MSKLEPHPLSKLFPQILPEDFDKLAGDIKLHGLHHPIVLYQGKILDGNNRYRACEDAKIAPKSGVSNTTICNHSAQRSKKPVNCTGKPAATPRPAQPAG